MTTPSEAEAGNESGTPVFLDYDQASLDAELNLRARWPEHPVFFERWAKDSAAVRADLGGEIDLAYGAGPDETLDLFPSSGSPPAPLLAFIHGGYWQALDKSDYSYLAPAFLDRGAAFASLNYGLAPTTSLGVMIDQIRRALVWLYRQAERYNIDRRRLYVAGHSAGGHLAAMALATDWTKLAEDLPASLLAGGCSISGVYDLEPVRLSYHNEILGISAKDVPGWSPVRQLPSSAPPMIMAVGAEETAEFLRQHRAYAAAWRDRGLALEEVPLPGRHHFNAVDALGETGHPLNAAVQQMLGGAVS